MSRDGERPNGGASAETFWDREFASEVDVTTFGGERRREFTVRVEFPTLFLFRLIPIHLFRGRLKGPFLALDDPCARFAWLRRYSFRQYLHLS